MSVGGRPDRACQSLASQAHVLDLIAELLLESRYLMRLRSDEIRALCSDAEVVQLDRGDVLAMRGGDYLVLDGLLTVKTVDDDSGAKGIGLFGPGEQLISGTSSRVNATNDSWLIRLPDRFDHNTPCIVYEYGDDDEARLV